MTDEKEWEISLRDAKARGKTVEDRIWYFLNDVRWIEKVTTLVTHRATFSLSKDIHEANNEPYNGPETYEEYEAENPLTEEDFRAESFNEYFFLESLCPDLITSKRDRFKSIRIALRKLTQNGDIVKEVNQYGEPVYHFKESGLYDLRKADTVETEGEKRLRELYNAEFDWIIPPTWKSLFRDPKRKTDIPETATLHFMEFMEAARKLIDIYKGPDKYMTMEERIKERKVFPKVQIYYE